MIKKLFSEFNLGAAVFGASIMAIFMYVFKLDGLTSIFLLVFSCLGYAIVYCEVERWLKNKRKGKRRLRN